MGLKSFYILALGLVWEPHFPNEFLFSQGKLVYFPLGK
jgi:hypothetical protein